MPMPQDPRQGAAVVIDNIERTGNTYAVLIADESNRIYYVPTTGAMYARIEHDDEKIRQKLAGVYGDESDVEQIVEDIEMALRECA